MTTDLARVAYNAEEVAAMLGLSKSQVYALIADGTIPSLPVGIRKRLVPKGAFDEWLASAGREAAS